MHTTKYLEEPTHQEFKTGVTEDQSNEETFQHPDWFQKPAKPPTLDRDWNKTLPDAHRPVQTWLSSLAQMEDPQLLTGPTFELKKGSCKSLVELEYLFKEDYKGILHWGRKRQQFYGFAANRESARDVYSKCRIIVVTKLQIFEWHNYKHLDWITVRKDDD
ncbi:hypothetical protein Tco_0055130, partial [Tanacetum coccineum]